jgi:hypothetical protein
VHDLLTTLDELQQQLTSSEHNTKSATAIVDGAGFSILDYGRRRLAISLSAHRVAKVAYRKEGITDNLLEWRLWNGAEERLKDLLCPTLAHTHGGVNIQVRCIPVEYQNIDQFNQTLNTLAKAGINDGAINLGLLNHHIVCFDYAFLSHTLASKLLTSEKGTSSA